MKYVTHYREHVGARQGKHHKATLFQSPRLLLGLNCLEPGQIQEAHVHPGQDKFYVVMEGEGDFSVGEVAVRAGPGEIVWAPADVTHGVSNRGPERLVVVVGIAPAPSSPASGGTPNGG